MSVRLPAIIPGDDYPITFTFRTAGVAESQAGNSIQVMVKAAPTDSDASALVNRTVNATSPDQEAGIIRVPLTAAETRSFAPRDFVWIQARRTASGQKRSPLLAKVSVLDSVIDDG